MAPVECLIAIAHAQKVMIHARIVTLDLSMMSQYMARIHTQFIDAVKVVERKRFMAMSLTIDGSCLTTRISSVCSTATSMLRHVGASRQSSIYLSTFTRVMTGASVAMREADKEDSEGNIDEIKQYRDARWVTPQKSCGGYMGLI